MRKIWAQVFLGVILGMSILLSGCGKTVEVVKKPVVVQTQTIKAGTAGMTGTYSGEVKGRYETQLAFQVDGKIVKRYVELGSMVQPGDILMEIDPKDIVQGVNSASAQVYSAQSQLKLAESNAKRYKQLFEEQAVSRAQYEQYQNAYEVAVAAYQQATAQYNQGQNKLGYSALYAGQKGVVSSVNAEAGQVVGAGQSVLTIVQDGEREVEISIPEHQVNDLPKSRQVSVTFWALGDVRLEGQVREVSPVADKVSRTYKARIRLVNPPDTVKLGMTASVLFASEGTGKSVYIPLTAVYQSGTQPGVWVVANGMVTLKPVRVGVFGDNQVQVLEGLQDGDIIVTAGVHKLQEGQPVRLAGEK